MPLTWIAVILILLGITFIASPIKGLGALLVVLGGGFIFTAVRRRKKKS